MGVIGCGEGLEKSKYLLNAVLVGVLHAATPNGFNLINAPKYAEEKLIKAEFAHETAVPSNKMAGINAAIPEMMASIVAKGASVGSFVASSTGKDGSAWAVVNVEGHFDAKTELKHLPFAASVEV